MKVIFSYEDLNGEKLCPRIDGKVLENQNDVINQLSNNIPYGYVLVILGKFRNTFKNIWMTGYLNYQTGITLTSPFPLD